MGWLPHLTTEFAVTMSDGTVWLSIGQALLFGGVCLLFGIWMARTVGLLAPDAPAGETLGVGLASGLLVLAAWWAAVISGGRSSFTPVGVGFAIAIVLALNAGRRSATAAEPSASVSDSVTDDKPTSRSARRGNLIVAALGGALFVVAVALLYGSTMVPSPRDGLQPIEFNDVAYYSILGADLAATGTESISSPSGFPEIEGLPRQAWYHWGEIWLASVLIKLFGTSPLDARHFVVLPLMLLAAAAMTGTLVRRITGTHSRGACLFGFLACLFLAPVSFISGPFFSSFARGMIYGITTYGLASVAVLLALYGVAVLGTRVPTWALIAFVGSAAATLVPAHIVIALLALVGVGSVWMIRIVQSLVARRRLPVVPPVWRRTLIATCIAIVVTVAWAMFTGHGVGNSGLFAGISQFNTSWRESVAITTLGAGAFVAIPVAWFVVRRDASIEEGLYLGTVVLLVTGALVWGARLADFNAYHVFFAGIAVFATPVAAIAVWSIWLRLRATGHGPLAVTVLLICIVQLATGIGLGVLRLVSSGPGNNIPVPLAILEAIRSLPPDAKLAYACRPSEEVVFWNAQMLGLDAHTGRRIVPLCFQAETAGEMIGGHMSADIPGPLFPLAPQRQIYPDSGARPSSASVVSFLKHNGIDYIYADALHPNSLVPDAIPIAKSAETQVLRVP